MIFYLYSTANTTKSPDGTLKASSPVINLYTDKHDLHNEGQFGSTPAVTRKSKGVYEITGTLGLRSDGWYLDTPNDRNGNKYFNVEWTQNITPTAVDGIVDEYRDDIVVTIETFERVWNKDTGVFDNGTPIDINELQDRFVQLRFNEIKSEDPEIEETPEPELPTSMVPESVTMRQAQLALFDSDITVDMVDAQIEQMEEPGRSLAKIEWKSSGRIFRNKPFVSALGQALGLDDEDIDQLFITADSIE